MNCKFNFRLALMARDNTCYKFIDIKDITLDEIDKVAIQQLRFFRVFLHDLSYGILYRERPGYSSSLEKYVYLY